MLRIFRSHFFQAKSYARFFTSFLTINIIFFSSQIRAFANPLTQLSNLSAGDFERQLELPPTESLAPGSPLMSAALQAYELLPYKIGERMRFEITYLGVQGGTAEVLVRTPVKWQQGWAHRVTGEVISAAWYKWITSIHDSVEGIFEPTLALAPLQFYINQQEGSFRQTKIISFNKSAKKVEQTSLRKNRPQKNEQFPFSADTKDALGALYFFRTHVPPESNIAQFEFPVFTSEKTWTLRAKKTGEEKLKIANSLVDTDVWELTSHFGGLMEQKGQIKMWLTKDSRRLPLYAEAHIAFGYIKVRLSEWDPGYYPPNTKIKYDKLRIKP